MQLTTAKVALPLVLGLCCILHVSIGAMGSSRCCFCIFHRFRALRWRLRRKEDQVRIVANLSVGTQSLLHSSLQPPFVLPPHALGLPSSDRSRAVYQFFMRSLRLFLDSKLGLLDKASVGMQSLWDLPPPQRAHHVGFCHPLDEGAIMCATWSWQPPEVLQQYAHCLYFGMPEGDGILQSGGLPRCCTGAKHAAHSACDHLQIVFTHVQHMCEIMSVINIEMHRQS